MRARLRKLLFRNLFVTLGLLLGVMQVVVGHWATVVVAGRPGPGLPVGLGLALLLVAGNGLATGPLRRARRAGGWPGLLARAYMAVGVATLLLGGAILASWLGYLPVAGLLTMTGFGPETVFTGYKLVSAGIVASLATMLVWGATVGRVRVARTELRVPVGHLPRCAEGIRILHLTDLHIGNRLEGDSLSRLVARANALRPDLVALTGDLFDFDPRHVDDGARRLGELRAPLGVFAVLGNHDVYTGADRVATGLARHAPGITLLRDAWARLPVPEPLYVAGVDDPGVDWTRRGVELGALDRLAAELPDDGPAILLVHRPEAFPQAARLGFPLVLAGHTHGGQLALPGGRINFARLITRFDRGLYAENGSTLYVNRGAGFAGPALRLNCPREIAILELVRPRVAAEGAEEPARVLRLVRPQRRVRSGPWGVEPG